MDVIIWEEVDAHHLLTESPIGVRRVQQDSLVFPNQFGDMSPLATSKSLEDEEEDEGKREVLEEVEA